MNRNLVRQAAAVAALAVLSSVASVSSAMSRKSGSTGWPQHGGPNHNGTTTDTVKPWGAGGPKRLWKRKIGKGYSSIAVVGNRAYTLGNANGTDTIWCLKTQDGSVVWKYSYPCKGHNQYPGPRSTPTVDGKVVYAASREGHVFCLSADRGKVVWKRQLRDELNLKPPRFGFGTSPLPLGKLLIVNLGKTGTALQKSTGRTVWKTGSQISGYASPVSYTIGRRTGLAIFTKTALVGVNPATGKEQWKYRWPTQYGVNAATPIFDGNRVFISSAYNQGCALVRITPSGAREIWKNKEMFNHANHSVITGGFIYGFHGQLSLGRAVGGLKCLDLKTGRARWEETRLKAGSVILASDTLVALSGSGELALVKASPQRCQVLARTKLLSGRCWTQPALAGGRLFARNTAGDLVCVEMPGR